MDYFFSFKLKSKQTKQKSLDRHSSTENLYMAMSRLKNYTKAWNFVLWLLDLGIFRGHWFCLQVDAVNRTHLFKVYNSLFFSIVTELCNDHNCLISEHFINPPKKLFKLAVTFCSFSTQPLAITNTFVCVCLCVCVCVCRLTYTGHFI